MDQEAHFQSPDPAADSLVQLFSKGPLVLQGALTLLLHPLQWDEDQQHFH